MKTKKNEVAANEIVADEIEQIAPEELEQITDDKSTDDKSANDNAHQIAAAIAKIEELKSQLAAAKDDLKKLTGKKSDKEKGPGVIATIFTLVNHADKGGISKADILAKLVEMFPEREAAGMEKTINVQLPSRMSKERGVTIKKLETGNFVVSK